jgi:hypothetical protein
VSIHAGVPTDSNILDWGETYQVENGTTSTSLNHVWNWQFTDSKMDILLELVTNTGVVTPYTPGTYYIKLTDYRNLTKTTSFMVPSATIQRNKSNYLYAENIVFTTTGSRNGSEVFMKCLTFSTSVGTIHGGTLTVSAPPILASSQTDLPTTVFFYEDFTGECNGASSDTFNIDKPTSPIPLAFNTYADGATISVTGFGSDTDIYLVMYDETAQKTYYLQKSNNGTIVLNGTDLLSSLVTATAKTLSDFYGKSIFIAGTGKVSTNFTFTAMPKTFVLNGTGPFTYISPIEINSSGLD